MTGSDRGARAATAAIVAVLVGLGLLAVQGASASRLTGARDVSQTFLLKLDSASTVRVFHRNRDDGLAVARAAARGQKKAISQAQNEAIGDLPADADVLYRTHSLLAGLGVTASPGDQTLLEQIPGVSAVYPVAPKRIENSYAVPFQAVPAAWESTGFRGDGETIAVIDTGVDYTHSDFGGPGTVAAYDTAHAAEGQAADPDLFPDGKVVGGIDLVGDSYNSDPTDPAYQPRPHPDPNPLDCNGHGTHVAGSAAGFGVNADGSTYTGGYGSGTDFGAMKIGPGVAPEASVYAIRVLGCEGATDLVTEGIERAVDPNDDGDPSDHVDVINMSLGADFGSVEDGDSVAANSAVEMGVSVVAAAGNAGDHTDISGSPGDASRVLSVASTVDAESKVDGAKVTIDGSPSTFGITKSIRYDWKTEPDLSGPVVAAPAGNQAACSPYTGTPFTGKVVLVKWHDASPECSSIARGDNLAAAGAAGFIFGSDSESFSAGINGDDEIPGVLMTASGAEAIREALSDSLPVTVDGTEPNAVTQTFPDDNDKVSVFSSRGIHATGNAKPDVAAVGNTVYSAAVGSGDGGIGESGTSMASPMVAGLAALVREANPGWTPLQVKADIMNTAGHDLYVDGSADPASGTYGPTRVGAGRIDAASAVGNEVLAYEEAGGAVSVSFGPVAASGPVDLSREVTVDNQSPESRTYDVSYDPIHEVPGADITVSPAQLTLEPGEKATLTVRLEITDPARLTKAVDPTVGIIGESGYRRETLAEAFGRLLLEPAGAGATLRVPVYASPRPASTMSQPDSLEIHRDVAGAGSSEQTAALTLSGQGVGTGPGDNGDSDGDPDNDVFSLAAGFELQATSGESPRCSQRVKTSCWRLPEERDADLKMVGFTSDAPLVDDPTDALGYFAFAAQKPWSIPSDKAIFQVDIDVDGDGTPDLFLYNSRLGEDDVFVSDLIDPSKPEGEGLIDEELINGRSGRIDTALYDSDVIVLPISLDVLSGYGIDAAHPRISYGVETYSAFSPQAIDMIGVDPGTGDLADPLSVDLYEPAITVTDDGDGPLVDDQPGQDLTVTRNIGSYVDDDGKGLMMVHFHNQNGAKASVVNLHGASSATDLSVAIGNMTAKVSAVAGGMPTPGGSVSFKLDGKPIGSAVLRGGVARLDLTVPAGTTHDVEAFYSGDPDFEGSSDQVRRADPSLGYKVTSKLRKNGRGWYRSPVTISFSCAADGSDLVGDCPYPRRLAKDGRGQKVNASIVAFDGGRDAVHLKGINIDRTRPVVRIRGVRRGGVYRKVKRARCVARDRTSGVLWCHIGWRRHGKRLVYRAIAADRAGNRRTVRLQVRLKR